MSRALRGIETYTTADSMRVMRLHYSSDPDKNAENERGRKWLTAMKKGFPGGMAGTKWQQEMEINFKIVGGARIFPTWDDMLQSIIQEPFEIPENWPIYAGYDYGTHNPCAFGVYTFESMDRCYKIDEIVESGLTVHQQAKLMKEKPYWSRIQSIMGDPSIWRKDQSKDNDLTSIGELFEDEGIHMDKGRNDQGVDMTFVNLLRGLLWADMENPKYKIFSTCKKTIRCYRNLRKQENKTVQARTEKDEPEAVVRRGVDPFDSDKYMFLSRGFDEPGAVEYRPGTWGWWEEQTQQVAQQHARVLG